MNVLKLQSPPCEIRAFESADQLARTAAVDWLEELQVLELAGCEPTVALPGGRIAVRMFDAAKNLFINHPESIRRAHFFWGDERCVAADHPESNYGAAVRHLLKPLAVPEVNIHRIPGEFEPDLAAQTAAKGLSRWTGSDVGEVPVLDLVILGMGEDGHVASLFPGEAAEAIQSPDLFRAVTAPKPPPLRVTMGYGILASARNLWVLASGEGKAEALSASLTGLERTPLGRVIASRSDTRIYTDLPLNNGLSTALEPGT